MPRTQLESNKNQSYGQLNRPFGRRAFLKGAAITAGATLLTSCAGFGTSMTDESLINLKNQGLLKTYVNGSQNLDKIILQLSRLLDTQDNEEVKKLLNTDPSYEKSKIFLLLVLQDQKKFKIDDLNGDNWLVGIDTDIKSGIYKCINTCIANLSQNKSREESYKKYFEDPEILVKLKSVENQYRKREFFPKITPDQLIEELKYRSGGNINLTINEAKVLYALITTITISEISEKGECAKNTCECLQGGSILKLSPDKVHPETTLAKTSAYSGLQIVKGTARDVNLWQKNSQMKTCH